jgi:hypothetical protein
LKLELNHVQWDLSWIDLMLQHIRLNADSDIAGGIVGSIVEKQITLPRPQSN